MTDSMREALDAAKKAHDESFDGISHDCFHKGWQAATAAADAKYLPLAEAWLRYKQDMRPETRNDYLRASSRVFDCAIPGPLLEKKEEV